MLLKNRQSSQIRPLSQKNFQLRYPEICTRRPRICRTWSATVPQETASQDYMHYRRVFSLCLPRPPNPLLLEMQSPSYHFLSSPITWPIDSVSLIRHILSHHYILFAIQHPRTSTLQPQFSANICFAFVFDFCFRFSFTRHMTAESCLNLFPFESWPTCLCSVTARHAQLTIRIKYKYTLETNVILYREFECLTYVSS